MNQKIIIPYFLLLFLACSLYLSYADRKMANNKDQNDWWVLYFENPKNDSMNFSIENNGAPEDFHWEVYLEKNRTHESYSLVPKGETKEFQVSSDEIKSKKIIIRVSNGDETREIYKIL